MAFTDRLHNRGSISTGYDIDNSLKFEPDNSEYIYRTPSSAGNRKTWTLSFWIKRTELADGSNTMRVFEAWTGSTGTSALFTATDNFILDLSNGSNYFTSNARFRDTAAWYHFVIRVDTTQGTASERARVYVNGSELAGSWNSNIGQNTDLTWNLDVAHNFARFHNGDSYVSAYYAEIINVDGTSLAPTAFGEFDEDSGIWKPKAANPTYGTNGFKLEFKSSGSLGADTSGNGHTWSLNAIAAVDQATDTPTNNFCTLNVLNALSNGGGNNEYTEGATKGKALETAEMASGTMAVDKGKWYYECKALTNSDIMAGWGVPNKWGHHSVNPGYDTYSFAVHSIGRAYYYGNSYIDFSPSVEFNTNDIVSVALDADNGFAYWAKNGTWMNGGNPTSGSTGTGGFNYIGGSTGANMDIVEGDYLVPAVRTNYATNGSILLNFGGYTIISISSAASDANGYGTFEYAPPSGYYALCTKNLAEYG